MTTRPTKQGYNEYARFAAEALQHIKHAGELSPEQHLQAAQVKATLALAAATAGSSAPEVSAPAVSYTDRLRDQIRAEGGQWDASRAKDAYWAIGLPRSVTRARLDLKNIAEQCPDLLMAVKGQRWTYDVREG